MVKIIRTLKTSEFIMRIREKFYPTKKNDPEHRALLKDAMDRYKRCTTKKGTSQMDREIQVCKRYWKCYPYHYFMYDLYRDDVKISDDDLKNFIPQFFWYRLFLPHYRSPKYMLITTNKIINDLIFRNLKIPQPETLFYIVNGDLFSPEMVKVTPEQIEHALANHITEKIFVKPVEGSGGKGIIIFHKTDAGHYKTRQNWILNRVFLDTIRNEQDYIIQAGIKQDLNISEIFPESVNTFRIFTENKDGKVRVVCAMLRIGRGRAEIDNISAGGICTNIDIASGKLGDFAISYAAEKYEEHPDTHFKFRNFAVSRWGEISKFTTESAVKMPFFTYLGWDIALTDEGPVVIETNNNSAHDVMEMTSAGLREAFGIDDPDHYWKNPGKRI
jgi:hypothetical protein